jgi:hypothetical protein
MEFILHNVFSAREVAPVVRLSSRFRHRLATELLSKKRKAFKDTERYDEDLNLL